MKMAALMPLFSFAQSVEVLRIFPQHHFRHTVPAGNYSGITWLGNDRYAVVDDKSATDGFYRFTLQIDRVSGDITDVHRDTFVSSGTPNRDMEGIAFHPLTNTLFIAGERDNAIRQYTLDGVLTGKTLEVPSSFLKAAPNYGLESLTYSAALHRFYTCSESTLLPDGVQATATNGARNILRLQSFTDEGRPSAQYFYQMDASTIGKHGQLYAFGVSELCALDNGILLVLERELYVPKKKIGSRVICKLYAVNPLQATAGSVLPKQLLATIKTRLNLTARSFANYEGMCVAPPLADGTVPLILVSDSQNGYGGVLKDFFKVILLRIHP